MQVPVEADEVILADAAAGSDYVQRSAGERSSARGTSTSSRSARAGSTSATSLNGQAQPVAKWLAKGPRRGRRAVQEGLAALLEIFTFRTYPRRARRLNDRVLAVDKAEDGASFLDVFEWFRTEGYDEEECFHNTRRIFRGGMVAGGAPFTKDACYCKGVVLNYAFIRSAVTPRPDRPGPFLFVQERSPTRTCRSSRVASLRRRWATTKYLPPMFRDLNGLAIWMAYSTFFSQLGGEAIAEHYGRLFERS